MSHSSGIFPTLRDAFHHSAGECKSAKQAPRSVPLTIRVTHEEKTRLIKDAGATAVSAYVRQKLFDEDTDKCPARYTKKPRAPSIDAMEIARLLGTFGQSELATSILALSMLAQSGELNVDEYISNQLERACDDISEMKNALIIALGVKPQSL